MALPTSGENILANDFALWVPQKKRKESQTGRASTTTMEADPDLALTIPTVGADYSFEFWLYVSSAVSAAGDMQAQVAWDIGGATIAYGLTTASVALASGNTPTEMVLGPTTRADTSSPGATMTWGCSTAGTTVLIKGHLAVDSDALGGSIGDIWLEWAQNTSNANESRILEGSTFELYQTYMQ